MRNAILLVGTAVSSLLAGTEALRLVDRGANPAVVGLDTQRRSVSNPAARDRSRLQRRQEGKTATVLLDNQVGPHPGRDEHQLLIHQVELTRTSLLGYSVLHKCQLGNATPESAISPRHRQ